MVWILAQEKRLISKKNISEKHGCLQMAWDVAKEDQTMAGLGKSGSSSLMEHQGQGTGSISLFLL